MQIRAEQFAAFQGETEAAFVERLVKFARENLGVWVENESDAILRERIKSGIARARSHGFAWQSSLAKFVSLMLRFCPNFDRDPAAAAILARRDVDPEERAELLFTGITAEQWEGIEERYEPAAWVEFATGRVL